MGTQTTGLGTVKITRLGNTKTTRLGGFLPLLLLLGALVRSELEGDLDISYDKGGKTIIQTREKLIIQSREKTIIQQGLEM